MNNATSIFVFGLDGILVDLGGQNSISDLRPNKAVLSTFRDSVADKTSITVVMSSLDQSTHAETWMWLLKHFKVASSPQPTYLFTRIGSTSSTVSALQNLKSVVGRHPTCTRIQCLDSDKVLLSSYRDFVKNRNVKFWRMYTLAENVITTFDSSFVDSM